MNQTKTNDGQRMRSCNVSMKFNFAIGGIAIALAVVIGYFAYVNW